MGTRQGLLHLSSPEHAQRVRSLAGGSSWLTFRAPSAIRSRSCQHPTALEATQGANLKSTSHRCHPILVAFVWGLTKETIDLSLGCLQGGLGPLWREEDVAGLGWWLEMCSGSEAGSYLRLIDSCITQLKAQGPYRTCNESKEEEEEKKKKKKKLLAGQSAAISDMGVSPCDVVASPVHYTASHKISPKSL